MLNVLESMVVYLCNVTKDSFFGGMTCCFRLLGGGLIPAAKGGVLVEAANQPRLLYLAKSISSSPLHWSEMTNSSSITTTILFAPHLHIIKPVQAA